MERACEDQTVLASNAILRGVYQTGYPRSVTYHGPLDNRARWPVRPARPYEERPRGAKEEHCRKVKGIQADEQDRAHNICSIGITVIWSVSADWLQDPDRKRSSRGRAPLGPLRRSAWPADDYIHIMHHLLHQNTAAMQSVFRAPRLCLRSDGISLSARRMAFAAPCRQHRIHVYPLASSLSLGSSRTGNAGVFLRALQNTSAAPSRRPLQPMDYTALLAVCHELKSKQLIPARIDGVIQCDDDTLCLRLRALSGPFHLYLSWGAQQARLVTGEAPGRGSLSEAFGLGEQLQQRLQGSVLTSVETPEAWERVAKLQVCPRLSDPPSTWLYCEVMGRHSNLWVTDSKGVIVACGHQVGQRMSRVRQLRTGDMYVPPPPAGGIPPSLAEPLEQWIGNLQRGAQLVEPGRRSKGGECFMRAPQVPADGRP